MSGKWQGTGTVLGRVVLTIPWEYGETILVDRYASTIIIYWKRSWKIFKPPWLEIIRNIEEFCTQLPLAYMVYPQVTVPVRFSLQIALALSGS